MVLDIIYNIVINPIEIIFDAIFCYLQRYPGIAIIAISIVMNFFALPLYQRADAIQEEDRNKSASMKHWVDHIKNTFKGDERYMKLNEYYRIEGYKPIYALRSMFPLLLQIPFFIAAYHYLSTQFLLSGASFLFLKDLGTPDQLLSIGGITINIMPIVMTLINVVSGYIYLRGFPLKDKIQTYGIAAIFLILLYNSPSGLVFYWTLNQIFSASKNVFMKLVKEQRVRNIIFVVIGVAFVCTVAALGILKSRKRIIIAIIIFICCCLPLIVTKIKSKLTIKPAEPMRPMYFVLGALFIAIFMGAVIPLAVVYSDPTEFLTQVTTPLSLTVNNVSIFIGFFVFWLGIYYYLSQTRIRNAFTIAVWMLSGIFLVNYLFFAGNYGIMSSDFVFNDTPVIKANEMIINLLVIFAVAIVLFLVIKKRAKIVSYVYLILIIGCIGLLCFYGISIAKDISVPESEAKTEETTTVSDTTVDSLVLSKNGKNVVVLVADMAKGVYVPYIFDERPELKEQFNGFTFYPNTLTYGICTKWGAPGLYGGHEYSPLVLNERKDELNVDKHDEALSVMPAIFSKNGYNVTVWRTILAGYGDQKKIAALYDFDKNIKTYTIDPKYAEPYFDKYGDSLETGKTRKLVHYSIFRVFPLSLRNIVYHKGTYLQTSQKVYSENFLNEYSSLLALPEITKTDNSSDNNFLMLYNALPHQETLLEGPDYEPKEKASIEMNKKEEPRIVNGQALKMETLNHRKYYDVNIATYIHIGEWLDYLKEQGVYDNTRIIIVSDHGWHLYNQIDSLAFGDGKAMDLGTLNCVLMVKDFNSKDEFSIDNSFMMNADVPALAMEGLIPHPINPFTGNAINLAAKDKDIIVTNIHNVTLNRSEKLFDLSSGNIWKLKNKNIFEKDNWEKVQ